MAVDQSLVVFGNHGQIPIYKNNCLIFNWKIGKNLSWLYIYYNGYKLVQTIFVVCFKNVVREFWVFAQIWGSKVHFFPIFGVFWTLNPDIFTKNQNFQNSRTTFLEHTTKILCTNFQPFLIKTLEDRFLVKFQETRLKFNPSGQTLMFLKIQN